MSEAVFRTVLRDTEIEIEEKRSTFIAAVRRVESEEEALAFVKKRKKLHPDARHTVFAYLLRKGAARYSDDAEPQGTAGMPTLEAIRRAQLSDVVVVTTRYFGGILLGAGGLTRAYAAAAYQALEQAGVAEYIPFAYFSLECSYSEQPKLEHELQRFSQCTVRCDFAECVHMEIGIPAEQADELCLRITELTAGRCVPIQREERLGLRAK